MDTLPDMEAYRFVAILNKKIEIGKLMNALGHMAAGLGGGSKKAGLMYFLEYFDKDGGLHPNISNYPFIVLAADNSSQIRTARIGAIERGISFTDFTSSMTVGSTQEQLDNTANTIETDLEYYGLCMFGATQELQDITKKFHFSNNTLPNHE
ncbi:MAG TPA: DUF2000 domain-containing protein [Candidatus Limnocylindrales bacterium]|nr:DUF2000 domain-containing protein [Candidatus Limnocylindrales bacterium]